MGILQPTLNSAPVSTDEVALGVSRRALAHGAAWSVPVVAMASAAPATASSPGSPPTFGFIDACKSPGNSCPAFPKGYDFRFTVCNPNAEVIYLYSVSYAVSGTNLELFHSLPALPAELAPSECVTMVFRADSSTSANQAFTAVMSVLWGHTPVATDDPHVHAPVPVPFSVTGTPPDCVCGAPSALRRK